MDRFARELTLTVIGSAAAWTRRTGDSSSCYLVELGQDALVLDLGHGSFAALAQHREPSTVRAVLLSHLHPDHLIDVVPLRHYLRFELDPPGSVEIRGPRDLGARLDALWGEPGFLGDMAGDPLEPGTITIGPFVVDVRRVTHTDSSFGFRVAAADGPAAGGPGLVYSGDCGEPRDLVALMRPGDVLLSEASVGAADRPRHVAHLGARDAAWAAAEGGASELILTHIEDEADRGAALEAARAIVPHTRLAEPGLQVSIGRPQRS